MLRSQASDLLVLRRTAYLSFMAVDCSKVNLLLASRAIDLAQHLVNFLIDRNRELNKKCVCLKTAGLILCDQEIVGWSLLCLEYQYNLACSSQSTPQGGRGSEGEEKGRRGRGIEGGLG